MTAIERLHRARWRLAAAVVAESVSWSAAAGFAAAAAGAAIGVRPLMPAALAAAAAAMTVLWQRRSVRSVQAVALWIEEWQPALRYALVTAADPGVIAAGIPPALDQAAAAADVETAVRRGARRLMLRGGAAALIVAVLLAVVILAAKARVEGAARSAPPADAPSRLTAIVGRVEPPAYTRLRAAEFPNPSSLEGLVGSRLVVRGTGAPSGITLALGADTLTAGGAEGGWAGATVMPDAPAVLALQDRAFRRLVVLSPKVDSAPKVVLTAPAHDTTYRTVPTTPVAMAARATDDFGLANGYFEYLISAGTGEQFTTVTRTTRRIGLGSSRGAPITATLALDGLSLTPGSVVSIRAVVFDENDVTGPGRGVSETRTIRIAEPRDSVAVTPAPPDQLDSMLVSQRLLNMRTDTLLRTRRRLSSKTVGDRSMSYSNVQESIRLRVVAVVAVLEDDGVGGSAPTEVSTLLRKAADEMQTARVDLAVIAPDSAMPHMRRALAILDQVRNAHRYYLRGRIPPVLVDVESVRLQGEGTPAPVERSSRIRLEDLEAALLGRVDRAARLYATAPAAAVDSLTFIHVAALRDLPAVAGALGAAIDTVRAGRPIDTALAAARRALARPAEPLTGAAEWLGVGGP